MLDKKDEMLGLIALAITIIALMLFPYKVEASQTVLEDIEEICADYNVSYSLVLAMAETESSMDYTGSNIETAEKAHNKKSDCRGILQVNPKWHKDRMERLGCTDLFDARQCALVAVDYLAELFEEYESPDLTLMIYNGDSRAMDYYEKGKMTKYASTILKRAAEIEKEFDKVY